MITSYNKGITLKIINIVLFSSYSILFTLLPKGLSTIVILFISLLFGLIGISGLIFALNVSFKPNNKGLYWIRALLNIVGLLSWLESLKAIGINEGAAIGYTTPIFTMLLAVFFCKEKFNLWCLLAILLGFYGSYIILHPNIHDLSTSLGAFLAVLSSFTWAVYDIICKKQTSTEHYLTQTFYTILTTVIVMLPLASYNAISGSASITAYSDNIVIMAGVGLLAAANNTVLFLAYSAAPVSVLMPFSYLRIIILSSLNYLIFNQLPQATTLVGFLFISLASTVIFIIQYLGKLRINNTKT